MKPRIPLPSELEIRPFTHAEGLASGLGRTRLRGSDLDRPFHGVVSARPVTTVLERCKAFEVRMPPAAYFSHTTAALLYAAPLSLEHELAPRLHVSQPQPSRSLASKGIIGHSVQPTEASVQTFRGVRVSTPARTFCDLSTVLSLHDLVAVGDHLICWRRPWVSLAQLTSAVAAYPGRRGHRVLADSLARLNDHAESRRESILRVIFEDSGITGFRANYPIRTPWASYRADLADPILKIVVEYQSNYHAEIVQFRKDMTRKSRLRADGWYVIEVNKDDLDDPLELAARIRAEIAERRRMLAYPH